MIDLSPPKPYRFDGAYSRCYDAPESAMDPRHVFIVYGILSAWPFKSALELGCFHGASSTAFIEAINGGAEMRATFCDVSVSAQLLDVVASCRKPDSWQVTPQPSWAVLDSAADFDFILVDASHDIDTVSVELKKLERRRPLCVMAHDTSATENGYSKCEGAKLLKEWFEADPDYHCIEDARKRPGERTERGLFFATTNQYLLATASDVFEKWG